MKSAARLERAATTLRTLRHLRPRQLFHQLLRRTLGPPRRPRAAHAPGLSGVADLGGVPPFASEGGLDGEGRVRLLHQAGHDPLRAGWAPPGRDPLFLYTLHYHGWIGRPECDPARARATLLDWIERHAAGVGWDAYPTSMRAFHWIGWLANAGRALEPDARARVLGSLAAQLEHLARHVELHLDGNHLWTNLAALAFAGHALEGPLAGRLAARFAPRFARAVRAQLGADGCHRERTPTYHCVVAEQLALVAAAARPRDAALAADLDAAFARMRAALPAFTHPDGDVALFGDSQLAAPVTPEKLACRAGEPLPEADADARDAGFARRRFGPFTVLWNAGGVGLPHQVGHVHADALSLELSLGRERVLVDAGTGGYLPGPERAYARSTAAHNGVCVGAGDPDQLELWASHRIGARAAPFDTIWSRDRLAASIRGWRSPAAHRRELTGRPGRVRIHDRVLGEAPATLRYYLPATCALEPRGGGFAGRTPQGVGFEIAPAEGLRLERSEAPGWCAIGLPRARVCLSARVPRDGAVVEFLARD